MVKKNRELKTKKVATKKSKISRPNKVPLLSTKKVLQNCGVL